jgi:hypothetical protein
MKLYSSQYPVELMSKCLGVSRGGYYKWLKINCLKEPVSEVDQQIKTVFEDSRRTYGSPRVAQKLRVSCPPKSTIIAYTRSVRDLMEAVGKVPLECSDEEVISHLNLHLVQMLNLVNPC